MDDEVTRNKRHSGHEPGQASLVVRGVVDGGVCLNDFVLVCKFGCRIDLCLVSAIDQQGHSPGRLTAQILPTFHSNLMS
jgi:hypothetical protein